MEIPTSLPPPVEQYFSQLLLSVPVPLFRDTLLAFDKMMEACKKFISKAERDPNKKQKCDQILREIGEIYERAKVKEKERESQEDHKTQGFMYSVDRSEKLVDDVFWRLRFGKKSGAPRFGRDNSIRKIRKT